MQTDDAIAEGPTLLSSSDPGAAAGGDERLAAGARAGDYEIERYLGGGAMGDVYAARHPLIGKRAAVKVIKRRLATSPDAIERFLREARAVNQVDHPHVVDVFAVGRLEDGRLYLVMDLLDGEALGERLRRGRSAPLSVDETLAILDDVAAALDAAHARGVVHRDLKPDNVFLAARDGGPPAVYVLDFGIAKLLGVAASEGGVPSATLTDRGTWLGTPAYMSPEQWGADGAGPASDRYALGVMAFEMLAGKAPFSATSLPQMMEQHFRAKVPTLTDTASGPGLPAAVDDVLVRAMAKDPEQRFATGREMVTALRAALGTAVGRRRRAASATGGERGRRSIVVAILGGAVVAAAAVTGVVILGGGGGHRDRAAGPTPPAPSARDRLDITTSPAGARVQIGGVDRGPTPASIEVEPGELTVTITKPGYVIVSRSFVVTDAPPAPLDVALQPVTQFEGVWALPDGLLRAFERRGEQVAMFNLEAASSDRRFARFFEFAPGGAGEVVFVAAEEHVDPRGADEPSCHVPLQAEYRYDVTTDALERRIERVKLDYADGHCALRSKEWGDLVTLRRIPSDAGEDGWVESRAGSPGPVAVEPEPTSEKEKPQAKKAPPQKKAKAPPPDLGKNAIGNDVGAENQRQQVNPPVNIEKK